MLPGNKEECCLARCLLGNRGGEEEKREIRRRGKTRDREREGEKTGIPVIFTAGD